MAAQRVLVIDDEAPMRLTISAALDAAGYAATAVASLAEAVPVLAGNPPDLIICDVYMADEDGFATLTRVRNAPETAAIPFILITGRFEPSIMRRGMDLGADDFLVKPFGPKQLIASVHARLNRIETLQDHGEVVRRRLLAMLDDTPQLVGLCDADLTRFEFLNQAGRRLTNLEQHGEPVRLAVAELFANEDGTPLRPTLLESIAAARSWSGDAMMHPPGERRMPVSLVVTGHFRSDGTIDFISVIARDATGRWASARALRHSEALLRSITENAAEAICVLDLDGRHVWSNPAFAAILTASADESAFASYADHAHAEDRAAVHAALERTREQGRSTTFAYRVASPDGAPRYFEAQASRIADDDGRPVRLLVITRDVTARENAARERDVARLLLTQSQKLQSLGRLAAGIAHEINTPTQFIGDNLRFLRDTQGDLQPLLDDLLALAERVRAVPEFAPAAEAALAAAGQIDLAGLRTEIVQCLEQSLEGTQRVTRLVRAMKEFSHPDQVDKQPADLNRAIENTTVVARNEWRYAANLVLDLDPDLSLVPCLVGAINQVVLNLIVNGAHAIIDRLGPNAPTKGTITVSTRRFDRWAEIRVADTGNGIPAHVQERIFEPFFTTKPLGRGTGQGLALARSVVVEKHGGELTFETTTGEGTCFVVRLPLAAAPAPVLQGSTAVTNAR